MTCGENMIDKINILPLVGIDGVCLGLTKEEVLEILGEPDERFRPDDVDERGGGNEEWGYKQAGLELAFSSDEVGFLIAISVLNPEAILKGRRIIGIEEQYLLKLLKQIGIMPTVLGDEFPDVDAKDYVCDQYGLSFWVQAGKVAAVTVIPEYDEEQVVPLFPVVE